jgi:hypothetical protein
VIELGRPGGLSRMENIISVIHDLSIDILNNGLYPDNILKAEGLIRALLLMDLSKEELSEAQNFILILQSSNDRFIPRIEIVVKELISKTIMAYIGYEASYTDNQATEGKKPTKRWANAEEIFDGKTFTDNNGKNYSMEELAQSPIERVTVPVTSVDRAMLKERTNIIFYDDGRIEKEEVYNVQPKDNIDNVPLYNNFAQRTLNDIK